MTFWIVPGPEDSNELVYRFGAVELHVWTSDGGIEGAWWEFAGDDWEATIGDA